MRAAQNELSVIANRMDLKGEIQVIDEALI
jgi:hypothetical protein